MNNKEGKEIREHEGSWKSTLQRERGNLHGWVDHTAQRERRSGGAEAEERRSGGRRVKKREEMEESEGREEGGGKRKRERGEEQGEGRIAAPAVSQGRNLKRLYPRWGSMGSNSVPADCDMKSSGLRQPGTHSKEASVWDENISAVVYLGVMRNRRNRR